MFKVLFKHVEFALVFAKIHLVVWQNQEHINEFNVFFVYNHEHTHTRRVSCLCAFEYVE